MAKQRAVSKHSRAARRATSPGIDTDKSLKHVKPPPADRPKPDVLAAHHNAGITKKKHRKVVLSTKARKRHEKSMDRAEAVMDRTTTKVEKSKGSYRVIQSRKRTWDEINRTVLGVGEPVAGAKKSGKAKAAEDEYVARFYAGDDDEAMEGAESVEVTSTPAGSELVTAGPEPVDDGEDEVL